jgi:hypothetical protein
MPNITQQLAFPVRVVNGRFVTIDQGSLDDVVGQAHVLVLTPRGWLDRLPDFGLADQAHRAGGADETEIERQLAEYVPDARTAVSEQPDAFNPALSLVGVQIRTDG